MVAQLKWSCQSSLYSDQDQFDLLHHISEVKTLQSSPESFQYWKIVTQSTICLASDRLL